MKTNKKSDGCCEHSAADLGKELMNVSKLSRKECREKINQIISSLLFKSHLHFEAIAILMGKFPEIAPSKTIQNMRDNSFQISKHVNNFMADLNKDEGCNE